MNKFLMFAMIGMSLMGCEYGGEPPNSQTHCSDTPNYSNVVSPENGVLNVTTRMYAGPNTRYQNINLTGYSDMEVMTNIRERNGTHSVVLYINGERQSSFTYDGLSAGFMRINKMDSESCCENANQYDYAISFVDTRGNAPFVTGRLLENGETLDMRIDLCDLENNCIQGNTITVTVNVTENL